MKTCFMAKDSDNSEDEIVYITMKDEFDDEGDKWHLSLMLVKMIHGS